MRSCFHIGFAKTGTTTLQKHFFAMHPQFLNVGRPRWRKDAVVVRDWLRREGDADKATADARWTALASEARDAERVLTVSAEGFSAAQFYDGPETGWFGYRLQELAGPVRVVITVRNQVDLLESYFLHKARTSGYMSLTEWLDSNRDTHLRAARYVDIVGHFDKVMGPENVGVFLFEEMRSDPEGFARRLCRFIGVDEAAGAELLTGARENVRKSARMYKYVQLRSRVLPGLRLGAIVPPPLKRGLQRFLSGGAPAAARMPETWRREIEDYYREPNRYLSDRLGTDLAEHGYPT